MIEYFVVFDTTSGAFRWKSSGPTGMAALQKIEPTEALVVVPYEAFATIPENLSPLKQAVIDQVNTGAGNFRKLFITDVPGQQATYLAKEAEARAWTSSADQAEFPYLTLEAASTGSTVAAVAALVIATADQWRALDPKIESRRRGATVAIDAASNIAAIVTAGQIDWDTLLTTQGAQA